ncbi:MAG TPA: hypothetical protein VFQ44_16260 [Streptosporangiaceae bacterium]|nr:hypothetical protein [Streptosporangiaceae bacterium]
MVVLVSAVAVGGAVLAGAPGAGAALIAPGAVPAAGTWGTAIEVPGLAALNANGRAEVLSVSCGLAGDCAAGGSYQDRNHRLQGFVASEQDGTWGGATGVPGLARLNAGGTAEVLSVSCGPAGNCAAGGYYYGRRSQQAFVDSEQNGTWTKAIGVPKLAALNAGFAEVLSVSCGPAGGCAAGGYYYDRRGQQGFVVSEHNGTWGGVIRVPGLAALNADGSAEVSSVSCYGPEGNCTAGGYYEDRHRHHQGFVASEHNGTWGKAIGIRGLGALNAGGQAAATTVSCASAGNCAAGGSYKDSHAHPQGFVVSQQHGVWGKAIEVPGLASLESGGAMALSVSCSSAGNCVAAGSYKDHNGRGQGFVASEQDGTWSRATAVPGLAALNAGGSARVLSVSCGTAGNCAAGGSYLDSQQDQQGFVVSEQDGTWSRATVVPGLAALNAGAAQVLSVSCDPAGNCAAGGYYQDFQRKTQGLVVSQS